MLTKILEKNRRIWVPDRKTPFPAGTKRKYFIGGIVCFCIWPGIGLIELVSGIMAPEESWYLLVSPWVWITLMGVSLVLVPVTIKERRPRSGMKKSKER